jgi:hypothetical protein
MENGIFLGMENCFNEKYNTMDLDLVIEEFVCTCRAYAIINEYVLTISHIIK